MITFPNAKINLGLNIVEKRPDGYHNLETIFYPINLQDALEVTRRENNDNFEYLPFPYLDYSSRDYICNLSFYH